MGTSSITCASLTAVPTIRGNKLAWVVTDPWPKETHYSLDAVEVHASTTNDRATATKVGEGVTDFLHAGLVEEATWYYWIKARDKLGDYGAWHPTSATAGVAAATVGQAGTAFVLQNGKIVNSVAASALTIAVKTSAGNDPSSADPVFVAFPTATGSYQIRAITAALSVTISSGSTLGTQSGNVPFRLWAGIFDDSGTLRLTARNCSTQSSIFPLPAMGVASSLLDNGTGAADFPGAFYTNTAAVTSKPYRLIGYLDWHTGLATAGTWAAVATEIVLVGMGTPAPGGVVQRTESFTSSAGTVGSAVPYDDTIPASSGEGSVILSHNMTPTSPVNHVQNDFVLNCSSSVAEAVIGSVFQGTTNIGGASTQSGADAPTQLFYSRTTQLGTAAQVSLNLIAGAASGTLTINGVGGARKLGGVQTSIFRSAEIMA